MTRRTIAHALSCAAALAIAAVPGQAAAQRVDRIVAFGDSYADDGNLFQLLPAIPPQAAQVYPTGRFTGGTNYVDTLGQIYAVTPQNFAIGGALTGNTNTNGAGLPGFAFEWNSFLAGGGGVFPTVTRTFDENDLVTVSVGGNDARLYQQTGGTLAGAPAAATTSAAQAVAGLNALVNAGAPTISFLAGNTAMLPEVATNPTAQAIRNSYSTTFNTAMQTVLAGYAAQGVTVHYLDLTTMLQQVSANPAAYGFTSTGPCAPATQCIGDTNFQNQFVFYVDALHPTSRTSAVIAQYIATQLQGPLTLQAPSELGLTTARQFGRTLASRVDLSSPRDGDTAEGVKVFLVGDAVSSDFDETASTDAFDMDGYGATLGASFGFANGVAGIAGNWSTGKAKFGADAADTKNESWQLGAFAGYAIAGLFAQAHVGYGRDSHDIERSGVVAGMVADTDGSHWLAGAKAGYLFPVGSVRVGPVAALDYAKAKVDGYSEGGDPTLTLNVSSVSAKSLVGSLGAELRGDFAPGGLQLRPYAAAMIEKEMSGSGDTVRFAQTTAPGIVNSWDFDSRSKKAYGRLSAGANAELGRGANLDAVVSSTVGRDQGQETSAHVGLSLGF